MRTKEYRGRLEKMIVTFDRRDLVEFARQSFSNQLKDFRVTDVECEDLDMDERFDISNPKPHVSITFERVKLEKTGGTT